MQGEWTFEKLHFFHGFINLFLPLTLSFFCMLIIRTIHTGISLTQVLCSKWIVIDDTDTEYELCNFNVDTSKKCQSSHLDLSTAYMWCFSQISSACWKCRKYLHLDWPTQNALFMVIFPWYLDLRAGTDFRCPGNDRFKALSFSSSGGAVFRLGRLSRETREFTCCLLFIERLFKFWCCFYEC